jgi:hypothetical protein
MASSHPRDFVCHGFIVSNHAALMRENYLVTLGTLYVLVNSKNTVLFIQNVLVAGLVMSCMLIFDLIILVVLMNSVEILFVVV